VEEPLHQFGATNSERVLKALEAGVDQFGGESCPEYVVELVKAGKISEARLDVSLRRLLRLKFQLGLFDNPFVDESHAKAQSRKVRLEFSVFFAPLRLCVRLFIPPLFAENRNSIQAAG
jgi:beta-glucosidase-like glycosyl hydrolase